MTMAAKPQTELQPKDDAYQLSMLVLKANEGVENGPEVKELRKFLDEHEEFARSHNVVTHTVKRAVMLKVIKEPGNLELFEREYKMRRDDLGWEHASPLERLMIERIMLLWVRLLWCEHYNGSFMQPSVGMRESEYADKMYARAHYRYVKVIESLARLRQVQAITKAADAQACILEMKEKTIRARINANNPNVLNASQGLHKVEKKRA
jgi:hypothetical protein